MIETAAGTNFRSKSRFRDERAKNQRINMCKSKLSRRFATVRFQQSAQALATTNIADPNRLIRTVNVPWLDDRFVVERLMGPIFMIMGGKFTAQMVQVFGAQDKEMVEALPAKCLDESLDIGFERRVAVLLSYSWFFDLDACNRLQLRLA